jgi:similar to stage IV sporulation protein
LLLLKTINYIKGSAKIRAEGPFLERFINICARRGISLWDVKKLGPEELICEASLPNLTELHNVANKTKSKIKITKKSGLPFLILKYRKRSFALSGVILFLLIIFYFKTHASEIQICGCENISREQILSELKTCGITLGSRLKKIDAESAESKIMTRLENLAWLGISVEGSKVRVDVRERKELAEKIDEKIPCDIVASRDGVITRLEIREGERRTFVGAAVSKGDVLSSGAILTKYDGVRFVHAYGDVFAKTWRKKTIDAPLNFSEKEPTGAVKSRAELEFLGKTLKLYFKNEDPFDYFEKFETEKVFIAPKNLLPPLKYRKITFREQKIIQKTRTADEAKEAAAQILKSDLTAEIPSNAEITDVLISAEHIKPETVRVSAVLECVENIARLVPIDKDSRTEILATEKIPLDTR